MFLVIPVRDDDGELGVIRVGLGRIVNDEGSAEAVDVLSKYVAMAMKEGKIASHCKMDCGRGDSGHRPAYTQYVPICTSVGIV